MIIWLNGFLLGLITLSIAALAMRDWARFKENKDDLNRIDNLFGTCEQLFKVYEGLNATVGRLQVRVEQLGTKPPRPLKPVS